MVRHNVLQKGEGGGKGVCLSVKEGGEEGCMRGV